MQQMTSVTTISDGEDEDDDVFDMSAQPHTAQDQRPRSTRPHTAGRKHNAHPAHRPATAGSQPLQDPQQR